MANKEKIINFIEDLREKGALGQFKCFELSENNRSLVPSLVDFNIERRGKVIYSFQYHAEVVSIILFNNKKYVFFQKGILIKKIGILESEHFFSINLDLFELIEIQDILSLKIELDFNGLILRKELIQNDKIATVKFLYGELKDKFCYASNVKIFILKYHRDGYFSKIPIISENIVKKRKNGFIRLEQLSDGYFIRINSYFELCNFREDLNNVYFEFKKNPFVDSNQILSLSNESYSVSIESSIEKKERVTFQIPQKVYQSLVISGKLDISIEGVEIAISKGYKFVNPILSYHEGKLCLETIDNLPVFTLVSIENRAHNIFSFVFNIENENIVMNKNDYFLKINDEDKKYSCKEKYGNCIRFELNFNDIIQEHEAQRFTFSLINSFDVEVKFELKKKFNFQNFMIRGLNSYSVLCFDLDNQDCLRVTRHEDAVIADMLFSKLSKQICYKTSALDISAYNYQLYALNRATKEKILLENGLINSENIFEFSKGFWDIFVAIDDRELQVFANNPDEINLSLNGKEIICYVTKDKRYSLRTNNYDIAIHPSYNNNGIEFSIDNYNYNYNYIAIVFVERNRGSEYKINIPIYHSIVRIPFSQILSLLPISAVGIYDLYYRFSGHAGISITKRMKCEESFGKTVFDEDVFSTSSTRKVRYYSTADGDASLYLLPLKTEVILRETEKSVTIGFKIYSQEKLDVCQGSKLLLISDDTEFVIKSSSHHIKKDDSFVASYQIEKNDLYQVIFDRSGTFGIVAEFVDIKGKYIRVPITENLLDNYRPNQYKFYPIFEVNNNNGIKFSFNNYSLIVQKEIVNSCVISRVNNFQISVASADILNNLNDLYLSILISGEVFRISNSFKKNESGELVFKVNTVLDAYDKFGLNGSVNLIVITNKENEILSNVVLNETTNGVLCEFWYKKLDDTFNHIEIVGRGTILYLVSKHYLSNISSLSSKFKNKFAELVASMLASKKRNVWLVGENAGLTLQDNGEAFFRSACVHNIPETVYLISRESTLQEAGFSNDKHTVIFDTFKHYLLYHLSNKLIVSHGIRDCIPSMYFHNYSNQNKSLLHLQHGITAMKRISFSPRSYSGQLKKMVVSSEKEKNIFLKHMSFSRNQVIDVGFSRYDYLVDLSHEIENKVIFIMPTWRDWLVENEVNIFESQFYRRYFELLNSEELNQWLAENNLIIKFLPHVLMRDRFQELFTNNMTNIQIVDVKKETINSLIKQASILVTDYSSVAFDFAYLNKPVIFYQFDSEVYLKKRRAYIDFNVDLFGDRVSTLQELISSLRKALSRDFVMSNKELNVVKEYFLHQDKDNFARTYQELKKM